MKAILKSAVRLAFRVARKTHKLAVKLGAYEPDPVYDREDVVANVAVGAACAVASVIFGASFALFGWWGAYALPVALGAMTLTVRAVDTVADKFFPVGDEEPGYDVWEDVEVIDLDV